MRLDMTTLQIDKSKALAYVNDAGVIILNPIYFVNFWVDNKGFARTGYIDGGIFPPSGPENGSDLDPIWDPTNIPIERCFFAGDKLTLIL